MDAVEYIKEFNRMCKSHVGCEYCGIKKYIKDRLGEEHSVPCKDFRVAYPERTIAIVEKWSKEHPIVANAMKFEEVFGVKFPIDCCPENFPTYKDVAKEECGNYTCEECENKFWNEPYEKPEVE